MASTDPFVHLQVASGVSLRHGASHPHALVERAAEHGMDALALTDRDGVYGAVRFALACQSAGIAPILGVDLAVEQAPGTVPAGVAGGPARTRTPARGGGVYGAAVVVSGPRASSASRPPGRGRLDFDR